LPSFAFPVPFWKLGPNRRANCGSRRIKRALTPILPLRRDEHAHIVSKSGRPELDRWGPYYYKRAERLYLVPDKKAIVGARPLYLMKGSFAPLLFRPIPARSGLQLERDSSAPSFSLALANQPPWVPSGARDGGVANGGRTVKFGSWCGAKALENRDRFRRARAARPAPPD